MINEPSHEIMTLFVLILQTRMPSHPVGLDVWFLVGHFVDFHTLCVRTAKALARLRGWAGSSEPSQFAYMISTIISWAGSFVQLFFWCSHAGAFVAVIDAVGKPGSNLLNAQLTWVGSYEECLSVQAQVNRSGEIIYPYKGQYCIASLKTNKVWRLSEDIEWK